MSQSWFDDVLEFHKVFCVDQIGTTPAVPNHGTPELRRKLMLEELDETVKAMHEGDLPEVADGLADLIYVAIGTAISYGIDLREVWSEVHRTNMAKVGGHRRDDGKWQKPPDWTPPDIAGVLARQGSILS